MPGLLPFLGGLLKAAAPGLLAAGGQAALGGVANRKQFDRSKKLAAYQNDLNKQYLDYYNAYNTPAMQMERFSEAGLNPHLIYSQGNPGNQASPQQAADYPNLPDFGYLQQIMPLISQTMLQQSQVQATNAKTENTYAVTALKRVEQRVLERNPLLNDPAFFAIIDGLISSAELKRGQLGLQGIEMQYQTATVGLRAAKIEREIELLEQRFTLGELDGALKAEVLKSKEFQNAILEVQKKFLADGDVGPQQILQFVQLLLMKIL